MSYLSLRRSSNDWLSVLGVLLVIAAIYGTMFYLQAVRYKEESLIYELRALRTGVIGFVYANGRVPKDVNELMNSTYRTKDGAVRSYVPESVAKRGKLVDIFGNPYEYNPEIGWIRTTTRSYSGW